jgi:hypothetical protein
MHFWLDNLIYIAGVSCSLFHILCHIRYRPSAIGEKIRLTHYKTRSEL